ncbi:MAG: hydroxymethylglutaryl-CoA lyase [Candidatus Obscuribacterales bacterium]|nr:hydroxymethylglutaryl-CoA lyase [Candidatus Obscuribacterales bacterium]
MPANDLPGRVRVVEVGPRDGLQNETELVSLADKLRLANALAASGLPQIEIASFVSPKWIPQMADAPELVKAFVAPPGVAVSALVPNDKGYDAALSAGIKEIALFMSATESHNKKNINKSSREAIDTLEKLTVRARQDGLRIRCYLSVVFVCPYEGKTDPEKVKQIVDRLVSIGIDELSLGDTIGAATPSDVWHILDRVGGSLNKDKIALHFHDTRGTALANVLAGLQAGVSIFDASIGGLGGCPYAPGASGNLATEDLVYMLQGMGVETGIDLEKLVDAGEIAQEITKRKLPGRYLQACLAGRAKSLKQAETCR